jgi:hypothetical protein
MSYDLTVWVGERPDDDEAADEQYEEVTERLEEAADEPADANPPSPRIKAYLAALLQRWPYDAADSPWAVNPLTDDAAGDAAIVTLVPHRADQAATYVAELAVAHGLVCYDPQLGALRP